MKIYKKSKLTFKNGYLVNKKNKVIAIDNEIVDLANELETRIQKFIFNKVHEVNIEEPPVFTRMHDGMDYAIKFETPLQDAKVKEAMDLMGELDNWNAAEAANEEMSHTFRPLLDFINNDEVMAVEGARLHKFDLPYLGNPLELEIDKVVQIFAIINGMNNPTVEEAGVINCMTGEKTKKINNEQEQE